jgi:hypothetical protein
MGLAEFLRLIALLGREFVRRGMDEAILHRVKNASKCSADNLRRQYIFTPESRAAIEPRPRRSRRV